MKIDEKHVDLCAVTHMEKENTPATTYLFSDMDKVRKHIELYIKSIKKNHSEPEYKVTHWYDRERSTYIVSALNEAEGIDVRFEFYIGFVYNVKDIVLIESDYLDHEPEPGEKISVYEMNPRTGERAEIKFEV